jgi:hypothetical protein
MKRRDFIKFIIASLASHPLAATAQRSIPIIGALSPAARPAQFNSSIYDGFLQGMRELDFRTWGLSRHCGDCREMFGCNLVTPRLIGGAHAAAPAAWQCWRRMRRGAGHRSISALTCAKLGALCCTGAPLGAAECYVA